MVARIPNLELLLYKAQQALAHDPDFVQKIAEIKENDSRKKVYLDFSVECFSQIWGSTCTGFGKKRLERFYRDMLKEHIHMREVYEMDDTYPERYKLEELCNVDVEALNNEFKEVIHNV